jgi:O-succinylbenzoic acid--CoA ligase
MHELVALAMPGGPDFVTALRRIWDDGDAVLPVDLRLPAAALDALLDDNGSGTVVDEHGRHARAGGRPVEPGDALVMATSGTTGRPKGVVLTQHGVEASAMATTKFLGVDPSRHKWLACLPLAHVGGFTVITKALHCGADLEVHGGFDLDAVIDAARGGVTHISLVPTAYARIDPTISDHIVVGGAAPPKNLAPNASITYGMTETGSGCVYDRVPLPGVELREVDGEIRVRGPMLLRCYRDGSDPKTADGWYPTGDIGRVDADTGLLHIDGRKGDLIISGGENMWPSPIERVLAEHSGVAAAAVVGRSDNEWGQIVTAIVAPADPAQPPTLDELRDHAKEELAAFMAPRRLQLVEDLPRTALGKICRDRL